MKKLFTVLILLNLIAIAAFAQFEDDDFFFDDGIEEVTLFLLHQIFLKESYLKTAA